MYTKILLLIISVLILVFLVLLCKEKKKEKFQTNENDEENEQIPLSDLISFEEFENYNFSKFKVTENTDIVEKGDTDVEKIYKFEKEDAKIDISNIDTNKFTLSFFFRPRVLPNSSEADIINSIGKKQVIVSSENWSVELKQKQLKFVYNNIPINSVVNIELNKFYHCTVIVEENYTSIFVNGNESKNNYSVPVIQTIGFKFGLSLNNTHSFYGDIGRIDFRKGSLDRSEICDTFKFCSVESAKCPFKASGETLENCQQICTLAEGCNGDICKKICEECTNPTNCKWLADSEIELDDLEIPPQVTIRGINYGDSQIIIDWKAPVNIGRPIKLYAIKIVESYNKNKGIIIKQMVTNCTSCKYTINGLKNKTFYDISVAGINSLGMGEMSNTITLAPDGPVKNKDISDLLVESDNEIKRAVGESLKNKNNDTLCNFYSSKLKDGHVLNKKRVRFADQLNEVLKN